MKKIMMAILILSSSACLRSPVYFIESDSEKAIYGYNETAKNHNFYNATSGNHGDVSIYSPSNLDNCDIEITDEKGLIIPNYANPKDQSDVFLGRTTSLNVEIKCDEVKEIKLLIKWFNN